MAKGQKIATSCARCNSAGSVPAGHGRCEVCGHDALGADGRVAMMRIGEVTARTGLSLRTVRYYEEVGLVVPSGRTEGGFRLYTEEDLARLLVVKVVKPLNFTLDETREILEIKDRLRGPGLAETERADLVARLSVYADRATDRCEVMRARLEAAEAFVRDLREDLGSVLGAGASKR